MQKTETQTNPEFEMEMILRRNLIEAYEEKEEKMNRELVQKNKEKLRLEKKKRRDKQRMRKERLEKLTEENRELKYLLAASELKWGDYKELDHCQKLDEKLRDYKITCENILSQRDGLIQNLFRALSKTEDEFIETLSKNQKGGLNLKILSSCSIF